MRAHKKPCHAVSAPWHNQERDTIYSDGSWSMYLEATIADPQATLSLERVRLVRLCARLTGDAHAAEDLAQEALLVAWQQEHALRDPGKRAQWLSGIARNLCLHWRRRRGLEQLWSAYPHQHEEGTTDPVERIAGNVDVEGILERGELAALLSRALALLPLDTREVLVERYLRDSSHTEVAARLGLSEAAVRKRAERGRSALKRLLATSVRPEDLAYGPVVGPADTWQETQLWCPGCGRRKLEGRFRPEDGELLLRCPTCSLPDAHYINAHLGDRLRDLRTYKPALSRVLASIHEMFHVLLVNGAGLCWRCGDRLPIRRGIPPGPPLAGERWGFPGEESIYMWCPRCEIGDLETWHSLTLSLPEARRFWREHPRMRFLPERAVEVEGCPAVLTGFESLTGSARLEVVSLRDTLQVVRIKGAPRAMDVG